ncbi:signal peptidase I [Streptomyces sp. TRM 70361]|uniref:signal peptidase I n=1 Tax=Streptomyces sp. TRM 70361 TaxID=3116553 RepID=UPI002E7BB007|nr:signal peptidase I [Streptomyces sp. TRM 70361]MEE1941012.1 signal peptidase I [Streptomyces sp. TRM 70361]
MHRASVRRPGRRLGIAAIVLLVVGLAAGGASLHLRGGYLDITVSGSAMEPTHRAGERIGAERIDGSEVRPGDVVLFQDLAWYPDGSLGLERVIATGGDRVTCCEGDRISVDGRPLEEPYVQGGDPVGVPGLEFDVTVPAGQLFLAGDDRANSFDSRLRATGDRPGTVPATTVRGRVLESPAVPLLLTSGALGGGVLTVIGLALGTAALIARRRAQDPPAAPSAHLPVAV